MNCKGCTGRTLLLVRSYTDFDGIFTLITVTLRVAMDSYPYPILI